MASLFLFLSLFLVAVDQSEGSAAKHPLSLTNYFGDPKTVAKDINGLLDDAESQPQAETRVRVARWVTEAPTKWADKYDMIVAVINGGGNRQSKIEDIAQILNEKSCCAISNSCVREDSCTFFYWEAVSMNLQCIPGMCNYDFFGSSGCRCVGVHPFKH